MFGEEIAKIRKLGVHGVSRPLALNDQLQRRCPVASFLVLSGSRSNTQQVLFQLLNFLNVVASGLVMWKALCLVTNSESPIVVVLS